MESLDRRLATLLLLLFAPVFLLFSEGAISGSDGEAMFQTTASIVNRGELSIDPELGIPGRNGLTYTRLGAGLPVLSIPAYAAAHALGAVVGHQSEIEHAAVATQMPIIAALLVAAMFLLARRLGASRKSSVLVAMGSVGGTFALAYTKEFFSEPLAILLLVVAVERALNASWISSSASLGLALLTRPQLVIIVPIFLFIASRHGRRPLVQFSGPVAIAGAAVAAYNYARFGGLLDFGYQDFGFDLPSIAALRAFSIGEQKSVILFAPIVLLLPVAVRALLRTQADAAILLVAIAVGTVVVTICVEFWDGGWCWGPRYLLPAVVPLCAAIGPWITNERRTRLALAAFAIGFVITLPTLLVSSRAQQLDPEPGQKSPSPSRQFALIDSTVRHTLSKPYAYEPGRGTYYQSVSTWQVGAARLLQRRGVAIGALGSIGLAGAAVAAGLGLKKSLESDPDVLLG